MPTAILFTKAAAGHSPRRRAAAFLLALAGVLLPGGDVFGYRFYPRTVNDSVIPVASHAARWDPAVWGSGRSLEWTIAGSPGWTEPWEFRDQTEDPPFASREEVVPFVEQALEVWGSLPSADITWSASGLDRELHAERDSVNAVRMHPFGFGAAYAHVWQLNGEIVECDVSLPPFPRQLRDTLGLSVLIHEFGHCVGLDHAAVYPTWDTAPWRRIFEPARWGSDPTMSYGYWAEPGLTRDDIVGGSLLRPTRSWLAGVGSITGQVTLSGRPGRYVPVFATLLYGVETVAAAGAFTNGEGSFVIEGLTPGEYLLTVGAMGNVSGNTALVDGGATLGARDQYLLEPVRVAAGGATRVPPIELREGREALPWPEE